MNYSSLLGIICGLATFFGSLLSTGSSIRFFIDLRGILIVVGGTLSAASISFPIAKVLALMKVFFLRVLGRHQIDRQTMITQFLEINKRLAASDSGAVEGMLPQLNHEFFKEAVQLVHQGVLTASEIQRTLDTRLKTIEVRYLQEANMFRVIGRFPPAFGLLATTLGMITLLQKIGEADSQKMIGPAMSIGLIGTLYGISLANLMLIPIAENLTERTHEEVRLRKMIIAGAVLLKNQASPLLLREHLNSYLLPGERVTRQKAAA